MCTLNVTNKVMVCFVVIQERCWIILIWRRPNDQTYRRGRRLANQCTVFERWILVGKPLEIRHCNVGPTSSQLVDRANVDPMSKMTTGQPWHSTSNQRQRRPLTDVGPTSLCRLGIRKTNVEEQYFKIFQKYLLVFYVTNRLWLNQRVVNMS